MGINDLLLELDYLAQRVKEASELLRRVNDYVQKVEKNVLENADLDLFSDEDALNREFGIDLFVVNLQDKVSFVLNQPKIISITSQLSHDIELLKVA